MFVVPEIGLASRTCLLPMVTEDARSMLDLYKHYDNGYLPFGGGILDQPAVFAESMTIIGDAIARAQADKT